MINLDTPLGEYKTSGVITDIIIDEVKIDPSRVVKKVNLIVHLQNDRKIKVNSAYVMKSHGAKILQGLWLTKDLEGRITRLSTLGKFMNKHHAATLEELKGHEIDLFLSDKNILVADTEIKNDKEKENEYTNRSRNT
jgi:uncharacterized protein YacL (UPF0231 family)